MVIVPFPFGGGDNHFQDNNSSSISPTVQSYKKWAKHPAIIKLARVLDLEKNCGYITMVNVRGSSSISSRSTAENYLCVLGEALTVVPESQQITTKLTSLPEESNSDDEEEEFHVILNNANSNSSDPANGFKSDQCAKLYQEELEMEFSNASSDTPQFDISSGKPTGFDSRQQKIESLRLDLSIKETKGDSNALSGKLDSTHQTREKGDKSWFDDWTLLDCHFGVPLFDGVVSQIVCEKILSNLLWEEER